MNLTHIINAISLYLSVAMVTFALNEIAHGLVAHSLGVPVRSFVFGLPPVRRRLGSLAGVELGLGLPLAFAVGLDGPALAAVAPRRWALICAAGVLVD
jgi:hypothetical protein